MVSPNRRSLPLAAAAVTLLWSTTAGATDFPTVDVAPVATADPLSTLEDTPVSIDLIANDVDPDSSLTIVEIDGTPVDVGDTVAVTNGSVTVDSATTVTFTPAAEYSGAISFTYTAAEGAAAGPAGIAFHLESTTDNGPLLFTLDLTSGVKSYLGDLSFGASTAMAYDEATGYLYFIRANGDVYALEASAPSSAAVLIGDIEDAAAGWTDTVPAAYSHQTASFYDGAIYFVPTARPTGTLDDALYRIDLTSPTAIGDVVKVADMSGDTVEWNNNDDIAIDQSTGILYGRSDTNDAVNSERDSYFYSYDIATGAWQVIASEIDYVRDYVDTSNNPAQRNDFRDASIGLAAGGDRVWGTGGGGEIGELSIVDGAWTPLANTFTPDDADGRVGGDLAGFARGLRTTEATVSGQVDVVNDPPVATDDSTSSTAGTPVTIDPIAGVGGPADSDIDGTVDPTSVTLIAPAGATTNTDGSITVDGVGTWSADATNGMVTFTPAEGFAGVATIDYTIADDTGLVSAPATISVTVSDEGDPTAVDDAATTLVDTPVVIDWRANDLLQDGANLESNDDVSASGGTITVNSDGNFVYTPPTGFTGVDTFDYTICDNDTPATCSTATVTVTVASAATTTTAPPTTPTTMPQLPATGGGSARGPAMLGLLLVAAGAALTMLTRRRPTA